MQQSREIAKKMFELFSKQNPATQYETDREISKFPKSSEIRYYYREDQSTADAISNYINQKYGKTIVVKDNTERQGFRRHLISLYIRE